MNRILGLICFLFFGSQVNSQSVQDILKGQVFDHAQVALSVINIEDAHSIMDINQDVSLIPASSLKVLTTFTAMHVLGEDYQYETSISYSGNLLSDGTLLGDIIIKGSGDPSLASPDEEVLQLDALLNDMLDAIQGAGISCITGSIIVDASIFEAQGIHSTWPWDDLTNYYASGAYGFNFRENYYDLTFKRSTEPFESTTILSIKPNIGLSRLENTITTGQKGSGDNAYLFGDPYGYERVIRGTIPPGVTDFTIYGAIPNPNIVYAQLLKGVLEENDIMVDEVPTKGKAGVKPIKSYTSPPLRHLIQRANEESINIYCEAFLKSLAIKDKSEDISFKDGVDVVNSLLSELNIHSDALSMQDGSGLSTRNRVSAAVLSQFIQAISKKHSVDYVTRFLPEVGAEGTVKSLLKGSEAQRNVWLKSGSMGGVQSYTGLIRAKSNKWLAISMISNGHKTGNSKVRKEFGRIIEAIYKAN